MTSIAFLQLSTIWAETADNARSAARTFVLGGLSEKHYGLNNFWVSEKIDVCIPNKCFYFSNFQCCFVLKYMTPGLNF